MPVAMARTKASACAAADILLLLLLPPPPTLRRLLLQLRPLVLTFESFAFRRWRWPR
jgi:hypothetical protein